MWIGQLAAPHAHRNAQTQCASRRAGTGPPPPSVGSGALRCPSGFATCGGAPIYTMEVLHRPYIGRCFCLPVTGQDLIATAPALGRRPRRAADEPAQWSPLPTRQRTSRRSAFAYPFGAGLRDHCATPRLSPPSVGSGLGAVQWPPPPSWRRSLRRAFGPTLVPAHPGQDFFAPPYAEEDLRTVHTGAFACP